MLPGDLLASLPSGRAVIGDGAESSDGAAFSRRVADLVTALRARRFPHAPVALLADNSPHWVSLDLAAALCGVTLVPLPGFFTPQQRAHAIRESGASALCCADAALADALGFGRRAGDTLFEADAAPQGPVLAPGSKLTFTSGTTGEPKGVCLGAEQQWRVASAVARELSAIGVQRHLCLLPLSVLLENVGGVYAGLLCGATVICPPLAEVGLSGSSGFDAAVCVAAIARHRPHSLILLPQMLQAILPLLQPHDPRLASLRFVAVGGARTPPALLDAAAAMGIPVFEGYGLTECGSVVALNTPSANRRGSVGRALAHRSLRISETGEIEVGGGAFGHYLGEQPLADEWISTGDLGHLDADGYLFIDGRRKNVLITGFGRNVSPEWPESLLCGHPAVMQALVTGDGRQYLVALLAPSGPDVGDDDLARAVAAANAALPDYARIGAFAVLPEPLSPANGLATPNGRPRRALIAERHAALVNSLYRE
jgi:long-subunit acyl-CoA synthetase (AMP-forming)